MLAKHSALRLQLFSAAQKTVLQKLLKGYFTYCNYETKLVLHIDRAIFCSVWKICHLCVSLNYQKRFFFIRNSVAMDATILTRIYVVYLWCDVTGAQCPLRAAKDVCLLVEVVVLNRLSTNWTKWQPSLFRPPGTASAGRAGLDILLLSFLSFFIFCQRNL